MLQPASRLMRECEKQTDICAGRPGLIETSHDAITVNTERNRNQRGLDLRQHASAPVQCTRGGLVIQLFVALRHGLEASQIVYAAWLRGLLAIGCVRVARGR